MADSQHDRIAYIYLLACHNLYEEPVAQAGYAYTGDIGLTAEMDTFSDTDCRLSKRCYDGGEPDCRVLVSEYTAGDRCRWW